MRNLYLKAGPLSCLIRTSTDRAEAIAHDDFTNHYMVGAREVEEGEISQPDVIVEESTDIIDPVSIEYPLARFNPSRMSHRDVIVIGEYLLERARQEKFGFYNLSSACGSKNGLAIVTFGGATNLGKTSTILTLVKNKGFEFVSDEKTLIDLENKVIASGTSSVPTRKKVLRDKFFGGDSPKLPEYQSFAQTTRQNTARLFIYPHLDHGLKEPIMYQWEPLDFFWLLTRDLSHEIRGGIRLVDNFSFLLPSLDTPELTKKRVESTKRFCSEVPCYYFQGSLEQVEEYLPGLLQK